MTKRLRRLAREWSAYVSSVARRSGEGQLRVVIFGQGRTGSGLLESLLTSSGRLRRGGELLNTTHREVLFPSRYVRGVARRERSNFIFHVKIYQLTVDRRRPVDPGDFLRTLHANGWSIVYLRRENKNKHSLSHFVREARGAAHKHDDVVEAVRLHLDCEALVDDVRERIRFDEQERAVLDGLEYCEVVYEPDLEWGHTHQSTANRVFDFLSLPPEEVHTSHRKVNSRPMRDLISNYDEFVTCVRGNGWGHFLD